MSGPLEADSVLALVPLLQRAGRDIESTIQGRSMGSTLPQGTRIRIRCREDGLYPDGAVVAFVAARGLVGHRVVGRRPDSDGAMTLLTRGDGSVVCDPPVEARRVLGEVTEWHDGQGWRPVPPAPTRSAAARLGTEGLLLISRVALAVNRGMAARLAKLLTFVAYRVWPPDSGPSVAGSSNDQGG